MNTHAKELNKILASLVVVLWGNVLHGVLTPWGPTILSLSLLQGSSGSP